MKAIKDMGFSIPNDISIIGFDNLKMNDYVSPRLTSLTFPIKRIASIAASRILKRIKKNHNNVKKFLIEPELIERDSVGYYQKHSAKS